MALLLPFYAAGVIGAGDVKLLGGLGALLGPQSLVSVAVYGAIVGGVVSILILAWQGRLLTALSGMLIDHRLPARDGPRASYGLAFGGGVLLSLILPGVIG